MRRAIALLVAFAVAALLPARADNAPIRISDAPTSGSLALINEGAPTPIFADGKDWPGVLRAAKALRQDLSALSGQDARFSTEAAASDNPIPTAILVGTLGKSPRIDRLARAGRIDVRDVAGRWEAYLVQVVDAPEPGIARALVLAGADKRGTIFGIYEVSRRLGVTPWTYWADVPIPRRANAHVAAGRFVDAPVVRYRGIFLNDEDPALGGWAKARFGGPNHRFYEHVFDLVLRLKGNYLWPAMWGRAFYDDDPENASLADEMGVIIATSHHEPMMRAHVEWERYGQGPWDYTRNAARLRQFWREGIERLRGREAVVTVGMRGDGDEPMSDTTPTALLERIVTDQRRIISQVTGKPAAQTPQVWALYKEVQDYFDQGMRVPDDVTLLFADDNWGNIRRLPAADRARAGGYGVYYHFDYVGGPRNYKWLNTVQIERAWEQMQLARAHGADRLWIVNVGDLKPMELPISFFLDQAWNPEAMTLARLRDYPATWAAEQFGATDAAEIGDILTRYTQYNARRKPELITPETWSLVHFAEADRIVANWQALAERARAVKARLPAAWHDAWYQLVQYPVEASGNLNALYVAVGRNRLYADQRRASANTWAEQAKRLFARDAELQRVFEHDIAEGKWTAMMSQPRIGYTHWQQPERNILPALSTVDVPEAGVMGVAVEGDARGWPVLLERARLPELDPIGAPTRAIEVFNRGRAPIAWTARATQPWLKITPEAGETVDAQSLRVAIDWDQLPEGRQHAQIYLRGADRTEVWVDVPVLVPPHRDAMKGFIESEGRIAIEAAHHARAIAPEGLQWQTVPNLGRTDAAVLALPSTMASSTPGEAMSPRLEYPIWWHHAGDVEVRVTLSPSLDFRGQEGLRFAVSIDDEPPQVQRLALDPTPGHPDFRAWEQAVSDSVHVARSRHRATPGAHTLKLWRVDPGVVFQRIEIVRADAREAYLGAPESPRR